MVTTLPSIAESEGLIPPGGAKIPTCPVAKNQDIKRKQYCNKFSKDFKNGPHQKVLKKKKLIVVAILLPIYCLRISYLGSMFVLTKIMFIILNLT